MWLKTKSRPEKKLNAGSNYSQDIAIIGMACRFSGANDYQAYWEILKNGINTITEITPDRWDPAHYYSPDYSQANKSHSQWGGMIDNIFDFDPAFFNISAREATAMDPQQRLLLQETWHCIEDGGIALSLLQQNKTGVFIGVMSTDYQERIASVGEIDSYTCLGNYECLLANRISFFLGLKGISQSIDTACSSSLVALHNARQSLILGESDYVFCGGVNIICHPIKYIAFSKSRMLSPTGQCKTFDLEADGYVPGEGIGILLLTTLETAKKQGHRIHAVIKGTAVNHSGHSGSITAPGVEAQCKVIQNAQQVAGILPEHISYIEAHGTGTSLGDPIEVEGLSRAFNSKKKQFCYIGSVKTNIGHCEAAAGIAGVIKTVLMMQNKQLVPTLNITRVNPLIDFANSPFQLVRRLTSWRSTLSRLRYAGVSSFGFGGVNSHVILEEFPDVGNDQGNMPFESNHYPFLLSAASQESLESMLEEWKNYCKSHQYQQQLLDDMSYTLLNGRNSLAYRFAILIKDKDQLRKSLDQFKLSLEKNKPQKIHLVFGELPTYSLKDFENIRKRYHEIDEHYSYCYKSIAKNQTVNSNFEQFAVLYSLGKILLKHCPGVHSLSGDATGQLVSSVLGGWIELDEALEWLCQPQKLPYFNFQQPALPIYDPFLKKLLNPYYVSADYIRQLYMDILEEKKSIIAPLKDLLIKAKELNENQYTFREYINAWKKVLEKYSIEWSGFFCEDSSHSILLFLILCVSLKKLFAKWQLKDDILDKLPSHNRLILLILDNLLSYEDAVLLYIQNQDQRYHTISQRVNDSFNAKNKLSLFRDHQIQQSVFNDKPFEWHAHLCKSRLDDGLMQTLLAESQTRIIILNIGQSSLPFSQHVIKCEKLEENDFISLLLKLWEKDLFTEIGQFFNQKRGKLINLPVYPFVKERYLIKTNVFSQKNRSFHPLFDADFSDVNQRVFKSKLDKKLFYLNDHVINGKLILPGAVSLEMVRAASKLSSKQNNVLSLEKVVWGKPIVSDKDNQSIEVFLYPDEAGSLTFEVKSIANENKHPLIHVQGHVTLSNSESPKTDNKNDTKIIFNQFMTSSLMEWDSQKFYTNLNECGFDYGENLKSVKWLKIKKETALGMLELPQTPLANMEREKLLLHPILLDGAFQIAVGFELSRYEIEMPVPFSIEKLEILKELENKHYVHLQHIETKNQLSRYDIDFLAENGEVFVQIKGLILRSLVYQTSHKKSELAFYSPGWFDSVIEKLILSQPGNLIIFTHRNEIVNQLKIDHANLNIIQILAGEEYRKIMPKLYQVRAGNEDDYIQLITDMKQDLNSEEDFKHIVDLWSDQYIDVHSEIEFEKILTKSHLHLLLLTRALLSHKISKVHLLHIYPYSIEKMIIDEMDSGFIKTLSAENPHYFYQIVGIDGEEYNDPLFLTAVIDNEFTQKSQQQVRYVNGARQICGFEEIQLDHSSVKPALKSEGVYLITGGLGGLGIILAQFLAKNLKAKLILTGRSLLDTQRQQLIGDLIRLGAEVLYIPSDIGKLADVKNLISKSLEKFSVINGIFHLAGQLNDAFIIKQNVADLQEIFRAKILGALYLDEYTKDINQLDYFVLFSSIVGVLGNVGQSAYASANTFLDHFSHFRQHLVTQTKRYGHTVSINWPLWSEGGMGRNEEIQKKLSTAYGIELLESDTGLNALVKILNSVLVQVMPVCANQEKFQQFLRISNSIRPQMIVKLGHSTDLEALRKPLAEYLKNVMAVCLRLPNDRIKEDRSFENYGIDSILTMSLTTALEKEFGPLAKTLFFEYRNLNELIEYFLTNFHGKCHDIFSTNDNENPDANVSITVNSIPQNEKITLSATNKISENTDIAIIGMAGRYPMANTPQQLWKNLKAAKDCVIEIPEQRWDYHHYYHPDRKKPGISYSKWGGFIEDFDKFDPLFFNISPREAELMDPQERLFLEVAWQTLEDAGYTSETWGSSIGVFVGVMYGQYQLYGVEEMLKGNTQFPNSFYSSIANRVSYFLNSHAPSMAIDTMCSSSLTSIHLACESIKSGESEMAVAGGVNISSHPNKYLLLSQGQFLSTNGKCRSFGEGGDGYVPGEGVGALLLKPLAKALVDGDHIYGVIKGSSVNHGGRTNGYTVPNPVAQAQLIQSVFQKAQLNPKSISYVEAHGTGTALGDPIEIRGLTKAFNHDVHDKPFCAIGSVKSNVGHLESAAGIVAVTKVLLQLQHRQLAPSIHSENLNPNLDLKNSPFYIQDQLSNWERPSFEENGRRITYPLRAGISSFGAGGSNAHLIIEEPPEKIPVMDKKPFYLLTLSAKAETALRQRQRDLLTWIEEAEQNNIELSLSKMSYTLAVGRDHFNHRLALIVEDMTSLKQQLALAIENKTSEQIYTGIHDDLDVREIEEVLSPLKSIDAAAYLDQLKKIADYYIKGFKINWLLLYQGGQNQRIPLPAYPFIKKRFWVRAIKGETLKPLTDSIIPKEPKMGNSNEIFAIQEIEGPLKEILKEVLFLEDNDLDINKEFSQYGVDSILGVEIINKINKKFNLKFQATILYSYPNIKTLSKYLISQLEVDKKPAITATVHLQSTLSPPDSSTKSTVISKISLNKLKEPEPPVESLSLLPVIDNLNQSEDIAVIGISIELPQVKTPQDFWKQLSTAKHLVTEIPPDRWQIDHFFDSNPNAKDRSVSKWGGFIHDVAEFDPAFFQISPIEAEFMDPQQRLFLKHCCNAIEDAGYGSESLDGSRCGIFAGVMNQDYGQLLTQTHSEVNHYSVIGNAPSILAGRVAYYLNLHGPAMTIDTACSSSLTAMHLAIQSLQSKEVDFMLVGGVTLWLAPSSYIGMSQAEMLSPDGQCKTFDNEANGFVPGEGVGVVLLKRLNDAKRDGDHIYGVIKGSGLNQDGRTNGITAPNGLSQTELINEIYKRKQIDVENIGYIETHGTGTKLGDPIEIAALIDVFNGYTSKKQFCAIGSVKTNTGHTGAAAGIIGLIKALLCLQHKKLAPSLHFKTPNEHISFTDSPFFVNTELREWKRFENNKPRLTAVSSFGFSGTNAHVVIEEFPEPIPVKDKKPYYLVTLSAKTEEALSRKIADLLNWIKNHAGEALESISYTLNVGRNHYSHRVAWVVKDKKLLQQELQSAIEHKSSENCFRGALLSAQKPDDNAIYEKVLDSILNDLRLWNNNNTQLYFKNLRAMANLYVKGYSIDWQLLHQDESKCRIALPTYPFARDRYWMPAIVKKNLRTSIFLQKIWRESRRRIDHSISSIIIIYDRKTQELANAISKKRPETLLIDVENMEDFLTKNLANYETWVDLSGQEWSVRSFQWIKLLQNYLEVRMPAPAILLQVTQGLESYQNTQVNLQGAEKAGLYRMLQNEYSSVKSRHLDLAPSTLNTEELCFVVLSELENSSGEMEICYRNGKRYGAQFQAYIPENSKSPIQFLDSQTLLITGGTRGIGMFLAQYFVAKWGVKKLILTGREQFPPRDTWNSSTSISNSLQEKIKHIKQLESQGIEVSILSTPLDDLEQLRQEIKKYTTSMGTIAGVIHAAGFVDLEIPAFLHKPISNIQAEISPKVVGLKNLYEALDKDNLQFMILCSSVSAAIPGLASGHSSYAMANAFMDYFASAHNYHLPIVSIQWPSWKESGFGEVTTKAYLDSGLLSITNDEAVNFLEKILKNLNQPVTMPLIIDEKKFDADHLLATYIKNQAKIVSSSLNQIENWLMNVFEIELKTKSGSIDKEKPFTFYGIDSILLTQILRKLNKALSLDLNASIFFEYGSIALLADWLFKNYLPQWDQFIRNEKPVQDISSLISYTSFKDDIAVVGMSCCFAGAANLNEYWQLLSQGKSAIQPVPDNCWGVKTNYYAGLVEGIYDFDPDFFKIVKEDVPGLDPQALLLLKESLKTIYHAGYTHQEVSGSKTGVFIGGRSQHQVDDTVLEKARNPIMIVGQNYLSANISQFFNFQGPSLVIDTACSSALVGMDMAVDALQSGKIQSALVGGVSLLTNPFSHQMFERRNLLRKDGQFHLLDQRSSGIVLGEGAGIVYLKRLSEAQKQGDTIYAVISAISINNDGRTVGPTAPNLAAQKEVMQEALLRSRRQAADIRYIDVNGSGSLLTDILEMKAIDAVYQGRTDFFCYLGSMKPNIGHPLCAEGIASFIKVVLMLYYQKMVPFLSGQEPMHHYPIDADKFKFCRELQDMVIPYAALNSFADGGTNAHVILKNFTNTPRSIIHSPKSIPTMNLIDVRTLELVEI